MGFEAGGIPGRPSGTVLVVDDDDEMRAVLRHVLELDGWRVAEARDGREALARLTEARPDVVLTDLEMPRLDGVGLARRVRNGADGPRLAAISRHGIPEAHRHLFDAHFRKPVRLEALRAWLAAA